MPLKLVDGVLIDTDTGQSPEVGDMGGFTPPATPIHSDDGTALICQECGDTFYHAGRGRKPHRCESCRVTKPNRGASRPGAIKGEAALRESLIDRYMTLSMGVVLFNRDVANAIRANAEKAADADIEYARTNATFRKWLTGGVEKTAAAAVVAVHFQMIAPAILPMFVKPPKAQAPTPEPTKPKDPRDKIRNSLFARPAPRTRPTVVPPPAPPSERVGDFIPDNFFPASDTADTQFKTPESVNAGDIEGMPGG